MSEPDFRNLLRSGSISLNAKDIAVGSKLLSELWARQRDSFGLIVRGHLHIEWMLRKLIEKRLPVPQAREINGLSFAGKVRRAVAVGIISECDQAPLLFLYALRNRFAHSLDARLTKHDEVNFFNSFSTEQRQEIEGKKYFAYTIPYLMAAFTVTSNSLALRVCAARRRQNLRSKVPLRTGTIFANPRAKIAPVHLHPNIRWRRIPDVQTEER